MSPRWVVLVVAGLALLSVPVAAHGNYVSADPQVSADGTVRIEFGVLVTEGFVVLHADDDGEPGPAVGHRAFENYVHADYPVTIDPAYWANQSGTVDLWAVMHRDANGNGRFDPGTDPPLRSADDALVADQLVVRKAETGPFAVAAERDQGQETDRNAVTVRSVRLGADGYLVLRADADGSPGRVVGQQALSAGEHQDVTVTIDEPFYERRPEAFALWAVVHRTDGDGQFNATADAAVTAGDARVMTRFVVHRTDDIEHTPTPQATASPDPSSTDTPEQTPSTVPPADTAASATTSESGCLGQGHTHAGGQEHTHCVPTTTVTQPGFGFATGLLAVSIAWFVARRRLD